MERFPPICTDLWDISRSEETDGGKIGCWGLAWTKRSREAESCVAQYGWTETPVHTGCWGWKAGQGQTKKGLCARPELRCSLLDNKESPMFEERCNVTQSVCASLREGTVEKRERAPAIPHSDSSWWQMLAQEVQKMQAPQGCCLYVGMKPEQPETSLFVECPQNWLQLPYSVFTFS